MLKPERIRIRMAEIGISQSELARRVGVTQATIAKLATGSSAGSKHLHVIARELGTTPAYLSGETDDASAGALPAPTPQRIAEQLDLVGVEQIDLAYGLGATFTDLPLHSEVQHFPRAWLERITISPPALLTWTHGRGDSMLPTINDGDLILIDRSQRRIIEQDALWAHTVGDLGGIKRLRLRGRKVIILSDNPAVPPDEADVEELNIVGRVVFVGRRI